MKVRAVSVSAIRKGVQIVTNGAKVLDAGLLSSWPLQGRQACKRNDGKIPTTPLVFFYHEIRSLPRWIGDRNHQ